MTTATFKPGDVVTYIGHTLDCKEDCGWPCCEPGRGCPWEERIGKKALVVRVDDYGTVKVIFDHEPGEYGIRFAAHLSQEGGNTK